MASAVKKSIPNEQTVVRNVLDDIKLIEKVAQEDRIAEAYLLLQDIEKLVDDLGESAKSTIDQYLQSSSTISNLRKSGVQIAEILDLLRSKSDWNPWNSKLGPNHDVTLFLHSTEPEGQYHFKTEGYLRNVSLIDAAAAILENELYRYWVPMCTSSKTIESSTVYRRLIRLKFDFVLLKKAAIIETRGDVLPDGSLLLTFRPLVNTDEDGNPLPKTSKDTMDFWGGILLQDIDILEEMPKNEFQDLIDFVQTHRQEMPSITSEGIKRKLFHSEDNKDDDSMSVRSSIDGARRTSVDKITAMTTDMDEAITPNDRNNGQNNPFSTPTKGSISSDEKLQTVPKSPWTEAEQEELGIVPKPAKKTPVIKVQAVFMADLKIDFIPDWIFNLGIRSTASMFVPMLQQHATLFSPTGLHYETRAENAALYDMIQSRIQDYRPLDVGVGGKK